VEHGLRVVGTAQNVRFRKITPDRDVLN